jgi:ABC-2 type transport system permease protein
MTLFWRFFNDRRRYILLWALGLAGFLLLSVAFYPAFKEQPSFDELLKDAPEGLKALAGAQGNFSLSSPAGFLNSQVFTQVLPIALLIFGIGAGARAIAGAEGDGTLELILANPVTRRRVAIERYASAITQTVLLGLVATVTLLAFCPVFQLTDGLSIPNLLGACLACVCFALLHTSIAFAVGGVTGVRGQAIALPTVIAFGGFVAFGLVSGGILEPLRFVTPWWWYLSRNIVGQGLPPEAVVVPFALSVVFAAMGVLRFERRDLRSSD